MRKLLFSASIILFFSLYITAEIPSPETRKRHNILETAKKHLGTKYAYGGSSTGGFDCSGFVMFVFNKNDIQVPRSSSTQYRAAKKISKNKAKPADLVFFTTYKPGPSHVGIYLGNGKFIHSPSTGKSVKISKIETSYWKKRLIGFATFIDPENLKEEEK